MRPFTRADRVGGLIQETLADILHRNIKDPRLEMTVITDVRMSQDLKSARIYFSTSTGSRKSRRDASSGFESAIGYIKRELSRELGLRYMPSIRFLYDESFDYGERIENLLKTVNAGHGENHTPLEK
ncbi:30S ribosome-binding factor RbfA [Desulfococcaceae bacterium HSG8]|nr:30S ribosome-binding factor RbfA [Desulfococcaceae bacterium HSG8]